MASPIVYDVPLIMATFVCLWLIGLVWPKRKAIGAYALIALLAAAAIWAGGYALELRAPDTAGKLWAAKLQYLGIPFIAASWLIFIVQYTQQYRWITRRALGMFLLCLIPVISVILAFTNASHGLLWSATEPATDAPIPMLVFVHGPWFWVLITYDYLLLLVGTLWLLRMSVRTQGILRRQALALLVGIAPVWIANVLYLAGWGPLPWLDLTPFAMVFAGAVYAWSLLRLHLLDIVPIAYTAILEAVEDGIIVVDASQRVVAINRSAQELLGQTGAVLVGRSLGAALDNGPYARFALPPPGQDRARLGDITLARRGRKEGGDEQTYEVTATLVRNRDGQTLGWLYSLHDITLRRRAEEALKALTATLEQRVAERTQELADSEAHNRAILETIPDLMVHVRRAANNPDALVTEVVGSGRGYGVLRRWPLAQLLPPKLRAMADRAAERAPGDFSERVEYELTRDGATAMLEARMAHIADGESLLMIRDLTAQREAERVMLNQAKLMDVISDAVISIDKEWRIKSWNQAAERIYGYTAKEAIGQRIPDITPTRLSLARPLDAPDAVLNGPGFWQGEAVQQRKDGSTVTVWASATPIVDEAGQPIGLVSVNRDMSAILQVQHELQASEARYREIVDAIDDMICSVDAEGRLIFANRSWRERLGYGEDKVTGLSLCDVVQASERNRMQRLFALLHEGAATVPVDTVLCTRLGEPLIVQGTATAVFTGATCAGAHVYLHDITRRVQAEEAQREAEARYRSLFEEAPVMYVIAHLRDGELAVVDCNALAEQTLGYERDQILGMPILALLGPESASLILDFKEQARLGLYNETECTLLTGKGIALEALLRTRHERDETGRVIGLRAMFVDISARKRMERQLQETTERLHALGRHLDSVREEEQTRIAREIHDELGQMLTALKLDVAWLSRRPTADRAAVAAKLAAMNEQLSDTIFAVQRIASELRPAMLDHLGLVEALEWLAQQAQAHNGFTCVFEQVNCAGMTWDKDLATTLFRIAQEALTNVARHADAQHVAVRVERTPQAVRLEIVDDGVGIDPAQVINAGSFGLIGIRERLHAWDGQLAVKAGPNGGTLLAVTIPAAALGGATSAGPPASVSTAQAPAQAPVQPRSGS